LLFEEAIDADGSIVTLYMEGQTALTARMFRVEQTNFGFYGLNSNVTISNLKKYK
jgi:beta-fructofuranosidase